MGSYTSSDQAHENCSIAGSVAYRSSTSCGWQPSKASVIGILLLITLFFGAVRFRLRNMPLERDEGEYAYSGQLLLQGIPPYKLAYNLKLPGIYAANALILALFGQTAAAIHLGLLLVNALSTVFLYLLTARFFGRMAGLVAAASYALLSASPSVMGFEAHATNFVVLPALIGIMLLLQGLRSQSRWLFFASGTLCGITFLMKQHGLFFAFFCFFYLISSSLGSSQKRHRLPGDAMAMPLGFLLPYASTSLLLYRAGVFHQFWFWTVSYAGEYAKVGLRRGVRAFIENFGVIIRANPLLWLLALAGLFAVLFYKPVRKYCGFTSGLLFFSFLALCPGAYFRPHYFVLLLPIASMLIAIAISTTSQCLEWFGKHRALSLIPALAFLVVFCFSMFRQREFYFALEPNCALQATYGVNPFLAAMNTADYIRENSPENATIAVLGSEPEIYFYSHRRSATGYLYMYSLLMRQKYTARMQDELIHEVESSKPEYVVYVDVTESWGDRDRAPQAFAFLKWVREYSEAYYEKEGVAEVNASPRYVWGTAAKDYTSHSPAIYLLKRKSN
jgi:hypothetical protein